MLPVLLLVVWTTTAATMARADVPLDQRQFTSYVAGLLRTSSPDHKIVEKGPLSLGVETLAGKETDTLYLNRIWSFCVQNPAFACDHELESFVAGMVENFKVGSEPIDRSSIRAVLRTTAYLAPARTEGGQADRDPAAAPFAGDLWVVCVEDLPHSTRVLRNVDLKQLNLSMADAIALGIRNLSAALPPMMATRKAYHGGSFELVLGDPDYESSRILFHDQWKEIAKKMRGELVIAIPATGVLIYGNGANARTLEAMKSFIPFAAAHSDRPISPTLLRWSGDGWEPVAR